MARPNKRSPSDWLIGNYQKLFRPRQVAARHRARLDLFGFTDGTQPVAAMDAPAYKKSCQRKCRQIARFAANTMKRSRWIETENPGGSQAAGGTVAMLDLDRFDGFDDYLKQANKASGKHISRNIRKAGGDGYATGFFTFDEYQKDVRQIQGSKVFRSGGFVAWSLFPSKRAYPRSTATKNGVLETTCPHHWHLCWGVFLPRPGRRLGGRQVDSELVGFITLWRSGNTARTMEFMGHGDHLSRGIVDLMAVDLLKWMFDGGDGLTDGLRYFGYGEIEHGAQSLADWKRRHLFEPHLLSSAGGPT